ncbi:MAG TPA: helix-turn-helix domain-containing protein [Planctomycetota bacterium]
MPVREASAGASKALRRPQQERSRRTLARLLEATEALLDERPFEAIAVDEIVRAARTSVGAFYARFRDKAALLPALYERYDERLELYLARHARARLAASRSMSETAARIVALFVGYLRPRVNLMRALALYARTHPAEIDEEMRARRARQFAFVHAALLAHRAEMRHEDPERAVELAVFFAAATCRDRILFAAAPHTAVLRGTDRELVREGARMMVGYLGARFEPEALASVLVEIEGGPA